MYKYAKIEILVVLILTIISFHIYPLNMYGDIEIETEMYKDNPIPWNLEYRTPGIWMTFNTNPYNNLYFDFNISNKYENNYKSIVPYIIPRLFKYHYSSDNKGFEFRIKNSDRDAWLSEILLNCVHEDNIYKDHQRFTLRLDEWGYYGINTKFIIIREETAWNDDAFKIFRIDRSFWSNKFRTGFSYLRKDYLNDNLYEHNSIQMIDGQIQFTNNINFAYSYLHTYSAFNNYKLRQGFKCGLRGLKYYNHKIGEIGGNAYFWYFSPDYNNSIGKYEDHTPNTKGIFSEEWYNFPTKAITLKHNFSYKSGISKNWSEINNYFEIWVEFIRGFKFKNSYNFFTNISQSQTYPNLFWEIEIGTDKIWTKVQYRIKDFGKPFQKNLYGIESSIKLTDKLSNFNRFMISDESTRVRTSIFSQIKYNFGPDTELFLEYGDNEDGNDGCINDGDFVDQNRNTLDRIKFKVKVRF